MEQIQYNKLYNIDKERLYSNFQRIENMNKDLDSIEIIAKFLENQSVGTSLAQVSEVLNYFEKKISKDNSLLDFAFEWIRANRIRLEYKKYINIRDYKEYTIALDEVIFLFFLKYDKTFRVLLKDNVEEYEFASLYQIFFNPKQSDLVSLMALIERNKVRVPTIIVDGEKIDTRIHTLREGLSEMVRDDYNEGLPSDVKIINYERKAFNEKVIDKDFDGTMLERLIKFYCFQKRKIDKKEFTLAINRFLSSYLQFNLFYNFNEFKEKLILNFVEYIFSGLTEDYDNYSTESIQNELTMVINEFEKKLQDTRLKGKAWIDDLKPILQNFVENFIDQL
ncbi:MAG: hypothetical protein ACFFEO_15760 [Candidatus Thorarchaeota archaeon]